MPSLLLFPTLVIILQISPLLLPFVNHPMALQEQKPEYVELALCSASVADTIGMIFANILGLMVPWR